MGRVFVTRRIPDVGLKLLQEELEVDVWEGELPPPPATLLERARGVDGILTLLSDSIDGAVMDAIGPTLKAIANFAVGYNNIDIEAARVRGIPVGNTPDVLTDATADVAVGLMLAAARHFQSAIDQVRHLQWKTWEPLGFLGHDLREKTLGIIGMGRIGQAVAKRCFGGWGMNILYTSRTEKQSTDLAMMARRVPLEELLKESDFVSIHTDLNSETKHLMNRQRLALMKRSAILVNTSRGGIVDQEALYEALHRGDLFAAGLDVTDPEPLPADCPLRKLPQCTILPHIGSATFVARDAMARMAAENLIAALKGRPMPFAVR